MVSIYDGSVVVNYDIVPDEEDPAIENQEQAQEKLEEINKKQVE